MKHYVCTGECRGVSEKPGNCEALGCHKKGQPLVECDCADGAHSRPPRKEEKKEEKVS